jgi:NAD(P)-dependent dehydrogenase (short-subunit alcohol dehydrogenase family)
MIRHVVLFRFEDSFTPAIEHDWRAGLDGLVGRVPGLRSLSVGRDLSGQARSWDCTIVADFDTAADVAGYAGHPLHTPLIALSSPHTRQIASVDFDVPEPATTHAEHTKGRVHGKIAIVTGGSGDLGSACVRLLAREGAVVVSLDVTPPAEPWHEPGITSIELDITDPEQVERVVARVLETVGVPDILVNAAGIIGRAAPSHESTLAEFDRIFNVNVKGTWLMTKYVVPAMIASSRGSIVNFSSIHGITGGRSVPLYHATKGAVRLLTKSDAATYGEHGIRVNSIHPGSMNTRMSRTAADMSAVGPEAYYRQLVEGNPLRRQGEPDEIAYGVLYLASDESRFSTGSELVIDGGYTAV